jgi:glycosyltransferase involved in cell wall biosynthesis
MKLSVLMPAYNEVDTLAEIVERVLALPIYKEIVIINDGSTDGTAEVANKLASFQVIVVHQAKRQGKGAAIRKGLEFASGEVVVIQDSDLEYDPNDLISLIKPIEAGRASVVYGVRVLESQKKTMQWGNRFVTFLTNLLYGQNLKDMETCYKMMRLEIALSLDMTCRGFDIEAEITAKLLRAGHKIHELPIRYKARRENKKLSPLSGVPTVRALWRYRRWQPPN